MTRTWRTSLAAGVAVALAALTTACSGGGGMDAVSESSGFSGAGAGDMERPEAAPGAVGGGYEGPPGANRTVVRVQSVIRTGEVAVTAENLDATRDRVDGLLLRLGGTIDNEQTLHDKDGGIQRSTLVLRVPVDEFKAAMTALRELGKVRHSDSAEKNVTSQVIDVAERVETLENSLDRLQAYQRAAKDIDDLIRFEQEITQREAELQSLKAQQAYLADQTAMSTITLYLSTAREYVPPPGTLDDAGFLAGLKGGWDALKNTVVVVLTVVGAVLPFAVALLVVGVPTWLLVRRTVRARSATPPEV